MNYGIIFFFENLAFQARFVQYNAKVIAALYRTATTVQREDNFIKVYVISLYQRYQGIPRLVNSLSYTTIRDKKLNLS